MGTFGVGAEGSKQNMDKHQKIKMKYKYDGKEKRK